MPEPSLIPLLQSLSLSYFLPLLPSSSLFLTLLPFLPFPFAHWELSVPSSLLLSSSPARLHLAAFLTRYPISVLFIAPQVLAPTARYIHSSLLLWLSFRFLVGFEAFLPVASKNSFVFVVRISSHLTPNWQRLSVRLVVPQPTRKRNNGALGIETSETNIPHSGTKRLSPDWKTRGRYTSI
jgi:hypothetical protein